MRMPARGRDGMGLELTDAQTQTLVELFPQVRTARVSEQGQRAFLALVETEQVRRGHPEPGTGAFHRSALLSGAVFKGEFDLSIHGHTGFPLGALAVDVREMILFNQRFGFPAGDAFLRKVVETLADTLPSTKIVRTHDDGFVALFLPSADVQMNEGHRTQAREGLEEMSREHTALLGGDSYSVSFTLASLQLTLKNMSHAFVLGPLALAEVERAYTLERMGKVQGLQTRELDLQGTVPPRDP